MENAFISPQAWAPLILPNMNFWTIANLPFDFSKKIPSSRQDDFDLFFILRKVPKTISEGSIVQNNAILQDGFSKSSTPKY